MDEGWHHAVPDVVVLTVRIEAHVGPSVESEAGEPASPSAPAVPTRAMVAMGEKPRWMHRGT